MSPPLLGIEGEGQSDGSVVALHCILQNGSGLKERDYLNLSDSSEESNFADDNKINLNLKATELRLGLPGSQSPEREPDLCLRNSSKLDEKLLFPLVPSKDRICSSLQKNILSGNKRGFSDTMEGIAEMKGFVYTQAVGKFPSNTGANMIPSPRHSVTQAPKMKEGPPKALQHHPRAATGTAQDQITGPNDTNNVPPPKAQVVGWPPLRTFRKNSLATSSKNSEEVDGKKGPDDLFVKVSMDGAPFLRKVDLKHYTVYEELSTALEKMFSCFTISKCGSDGAPGREMPRESKLRDLMHGSEYALTYEDKDGDWMLVGDVPWEMFIYSCKRLKIMKSSDAIGLAPRAAMEKSKTKN